jgi:hypothetical protein
MTTRIPEKQAAVPSGGAIFARVANPASAVIVPAPPAGFMNLAVIEAHNADAALTLSFRLNDTDGGVGGPGAATVAASADAFPVLSAVPALLTSALTADVSGGTGGTPLECRGNYVQVPRPVGLVIGVLVLTNAFQTVPNVVPASGVNEPYRLSPLWENSGLGSVVFNGDTAAAVLNWKLTRSAQVFQWSTNLTGNGTRTSSSGFPALLPGDVLEAKLAAPPVVAGSIIFRGTFRPAPLAL